MARSQSFNAVYLMLKSDSEFFQNESILSVEKCYDVLNIKQWMLDMARTTSVTIGSELDGFVTSWLNLGVMVQPVKFNAFGFYALQSARKVSFTALKNAIVAGEQSGESSSTLRDIAAQVKKASCISYRILLLKTSTTIYEYTLLNFGVLQADQYTDDLERTFVYIYFLVGSPHLGYECTEFRLECVGMIIRKCDFYRKREK